MLSSIQYSFFTREIGFEQVGSYYVEGANKVIFVFILSVGNQRQTGGHGQHLKTVHSLDAYNNPQIPTFSGMRYHEVTVITCFCAVRFIAFIRVLFSQQITSKV